MRPLFYCYCCCCRGSHKKKTDTVTVTAPVDAGVRCYFHALWLVRVQTSTSLPPLLNFCVVPPSSECDHLPNQRLLNVHVQFLHVNLTNISKTKMISHLSSWTSFLLRWCQKERANSSVTPLWRCNTKRNDHAIFKILYVKKVGIWVETNYIILLLIPLGKAWTRSSFRFLQSALN